MVKVVASLFVVGSHLPPANASIEHRRGKDYSDQRSIVLCTVQDDWMSQEWPAGGDNNESCEEYSQSEYSDTDYDVACCDELEAYMDAPAL